MLKHSLPWLVAFGCFSPSMASMANAQGRPLLLADRTAGDDHALELELDFSHVSLDSPLGDAAVNTLLPKLYGSFGLTRSLELELKLPTVFIDFEPEVGDGDSEWLFANPYLALMYADRDGDSVARIGFGLGLPLMDPDTGIEPLAPAYAAATRGLQDPWLYAPDALSFVVPGQVQMRSDALVVGVDGALGLLVDVDDDDGDDDADVALQVGGLVGAALSELTLGVRLQVASVLTSDGDGTQVSLMPFVQADFRGSGFVHGGLLLNLDDPYGLFGDNDYEVWALRFGAGLRF